jgi:MFS family permease
VKFVSFTQFFHSLYFQIPIWASFELRFITLSQVALIEVILSASQLILELPTGALADLIGRKNTIAFGYLIGAIASLTFAFSTSFESLLFSALLSGLFESMISGSEDALVFDTLKESKKEEQFSELNNKFQILFNWGMAIATVIGGLAYGINYRLPNILNAVALLFAATFTLKLIEPNIDSEIFTLKNYLKQTKNGFKELFKNKDAKTNSIFYILVGGLTWPVIIGLKNISFITLGYSEKSIGFILPVINLLAVYLLHLLIKKGFFSSLKRTYLLLSIVPTLSIFMGVFINKILLIPMIFILTFISGARWNILGKLTNNHFSSKNRATAISTLNMFISVIYVFIMLIFSFISKNNDNSLKIIYLILAMITLVLLLPTGIKITKDVDNKKIKFGKKEKIDLEQLQPSAITDN